MVLKLCYAQESVTNERPNGQARSNMPPTLKKIGGGGGHNKLFSNYLFFKGNLCKFYYSYNLYNLLKFCFVFVSVVSNASEGLCIFSEGI